MTPLPIPASPHDLTPEWLTAALGESVTDAVWERVGEDYGFTGLVGRVRLVYERGGGTAPASLVAKLPMARGAAVSGLRARQERDPLLIRRYYERAATEARFYREVGASFAPTLYFAGVDDEAQRVVLLLEDLVGARQGDVLRGCSIDDAALVLDELAPFHARWWGSAEPRFPSARGDPAARQQRYGPRADAFLQRFGDRLPAAVRDLTDRLRSELARVVVALGEGARTLIHGDLHLDNMLFDAPERPVVVLDWQTASIGAPAWDLALFLYGSLSADDRRVAEDELLARYVARLAAHGVRYPVEDVRRERSLALLVLFAGTVAGIGSLDPAELSMRELALQERAVGDGRLVTALLDHAAAALSV